MAEFRGAAPLPTQNRWLARIRRSFEAVYAGAALAIDYGVLPWGNKSTLAAIRVCMMDAMAQLTANIDAGSVPQSSIRPDAVLLAEFKDRVDNAAFVRIDRQKRKKGSLQRKLQKADGVVRSTMSGAIERLLLSKTLEEWYPHGGARKRLVALLRSLRVFGKGRRPDTSTRQIFISELGGKMPCYVLSRKRLRSALATSRPGA